MLDLFFSCMAGFSLDALYLKRKTKKEKMFYQRYFSFLMNRGPKKFTGYTKENQQLNSVNSCFDLSCVSQPVKANTTKINKTSSLHRRVHATDRDKVVICAERRANMPECKYVKKNLLKRYPPILPFVQIMSRESLSLHKGLYRAHAPALTR